MSLNPNVKITISGGGSGAGIKAAQTGTSDIGAASRELKTEEIGTVVETVIAKDAIAIAVNPSLGITNLTIAQIRDIFAGNITNWSEVGGPNKTINVVAREEGSGTRGAFEEIVMGDAVITASAILQNSNGALRTTVAGDSYAIGFLSLGYVDSSVKALDVDGVAATVENTKNGSYSIVRPFLFLTQEEPTGLVKAFIDWVLTPKAMPSCPRTTFR
jgi:phosphate transport system substrate-binding protein